MSLEDVLGKPVKSDDIEDALTGANTNQSKILKKTIAFPVSQLPQNHSWFTMATGSCCGLLSPVVIPRGSWRVHQRHLDDMSVDNAYQRFLRLRLRPGYGVTTAVIDGGIIKHPDLQNVDRELSNKFTPYPSDGLSYPDPRVDPHGSGCAGVIGAQGRAYVNGAAPFCKLVDLNVNGNAANIERAVRYCNSMIDVYSISQGQQGSGTPFAVDNMLFNLDTRKLSEGILMGLKEGRSGYGCVYVLSAGKIYLPSFFCLIDGFVMQ